MTPVFRALVPMLLGFAIFSTCAAPARASAGENWPQRPIRLVVSAPAASSVDIVGRVLADGLKEKWGQAIIVDNKPAAGGTVAAAEVARAPADGYTLLLGFTGPLATAQSLYKSLPYDPKKDFAPISLTATQPNIVVVHPAVNATSMGELIALARATPGKLNYASVGNGSVTHLATELIKREANVDIVHVPFNGGPPAVQAVITGDVELMLSPPSNVLGHIRAGKLKAIAVTGAKRFDALPDVPTVAESGIRALQQFEATSWNALVAPKGTPAEIVAKLNAAVREVLESPAARKRLGDAGVEPLTASPNATAEWIAREAKKWGAVIRLTGAKID
jgi:tripartite-type tricarboxylate transporter receptor subunit TctC